MSLLVTSSSLFRKILPTALVFIGMGSFSMVAPASAKLIYDHKIFETFANDLMNGLKQTNMEEISRISSHGRLSVSIAPIMLKNRGNRLVTPEMANNLNVFLLAALMEKSRMKFRFQINQPDEFMDNSLCNSGSNNFKCTESNNFHSTDAAPSQADIIISGRLIVNDGRGSLSYLAIAPKTGLILAASTPQKIIVRNLGYMQRDTRQRRNTNTDNNEYLDPIRYQIFQLQRSLNRLGYRPGKKNGYLTPKTRNAIRSYQWHHDLVVTGIFSRKLLKHVYKQIARGPAYQG